MGERKVLNKYFPPDFDPADLPRGQRAKDNAMKVRMMLPMTIRCKTCGEFMYKGTKFNCKKEDVMGENYLGLQIFRFYMHCRKCSAEITYTTDPQNHDYKMEHGATRNFEAVKHEQSIEEALKSKRAAEDEDKLKRIENKTADAKREMDMFEKLDDMLHTKGQHAAVTTESAIAALTARAEDEARVTGVGDLTEADEQALRLLVEGGKFTRRLEEDEDAGQPKLGLTRRLAAPAPKKQGVKVQAAVKRRRPEFNAGSTPQVNGNASVDAGGGKSLRQSEHAAASAQNNGNTSAAGAEVGITSTPTGIGSTQIAVGMQQGGLGLGTYSSSSASDDASA